MPLGVDSKAYKPCRETIVTRCDYKLFVRGGKEITEKLVAFTGMLPPILPSAQHHILNRPTIETWPAVRDSHDRARFICRHGGRVYRRKFRLTIV